jgi:hypothetical protein
MSERMLIADLIKALATLPKEAEVLILAADETEGEPFLLWTGERLEIRGLLPDTPDEYE